MPDIGSALVSDALEQRSFRKRFGSCSPFLFSVLVLILLLGIPLSAWTDETPQHSPTQGQESIDGTGRTINRPLVFLANKNLPPMTYIHDGKLIGIIVDFGEALKKQMNQPVRLEYMGWAEAQQNVLEGTADALLHINSSEERRKRFEFSDALLDSEFSIYINHTSNDIYQPDDLRGLKVGVQNKGLVFNLLKQDPLIDLVAFADILNGFRSLEKGELDAIVMDRHVGSFLLAENKIRGIRITGEPIERSSSRIAVRKGDTALLAEINSALAEIKENGTYTNIMSKWQPKEVVFQTKEAVEARENTLFALYALAGMAGVMILMLVFWTRSLKRLVNNSTSELVSINQSLATEITERKKIENELRGSHDYLRNLTDSLGEVVFSIKMPERTMEWINDSFGILGYTSEVCIGKGTDLFYADRNDYLTVGEQMAKAFAEGKEIIYTEADLKRKNGEIFPAEATLTLNRVNNEVVSMIGILRDVSARKLAEKKIMQYQKRLKALASQLTIAEEKERKRIATDLHDDVCQSLALVRMQVSAVRKKTLDPSMTTKLDEISDSLSQTLNHTRHLMSDLSSPEMNEIGLSAAISQLLEEFIEKRHGLKTEFIDDTGELQRGELEHKTRAILFRNVRELLTNVIKHARAKKVSIHIYEEDSRVMISIQDDGIGFEPDAVLENTQDSGFGLFSIKERMFDMNGTFEIFSEPGKGCKAILMVPSMSPQLET